LQNRSRKFWKGQSLGRIMDVTSDSTTLPTDTDTEQDKFQKFAKQ